MTTDTDNLALSLRKRIDSALERYFRILDDGKPTNYIFDAYDKMRFTKTQFEHKVGKPVAEQWAMSEPPAIERCEVENIRLAKKADMINHPPHYTACPSGIECIEITELLPFCLGNCYKYLHRAGLKGDIIADLKKALWYANRAHANGERLTELAESRINTVISHLDRQKDKDRLYLTWAFLSFGRVDLPLYLITTLILHISNLESKTNNEPNIADIMRAAMDDRPA